MNISKSNLPVIVIGAGIAGLTAAWRLKQAGIDVLVLEADQHVGGRMHTVQVEDALIDCGAQFLSSAYPVILQLITEMGLGAELVPSKERVGLVRNKDIALIHPQKPWHLVTKHVLSIWNLLRLGFMQVKLFNLQNKSLPLNDISAWIKYDNQRASDWVKNNFGVSITRELTIPIINGFYFQSLADLSAAMIAPVLAFSAHKPQTMTLLRGMGTLPEAIAAKLKVKLGVEVTSLKETPAGVEINSNLGEFKADQVILAVPAPIAKNILQNPDEQTRTLLNTSYSSTVVISLLTDDDWRPPEKLFSVYGLLFNPEQDSKIAALTIENNKCATRKKQGYLINVMLNDESAKKIVHLTDDEIYATIQQDIEKVFPALYKHIKLKKLFRWPHAMPNTPLGRATAVKHYRDSRNSNQRIWLAGDYLGLPWTDSAAQTGNWAATQICRIHLGKENE